MFVSALAFAVPSAHAGRGWGLKLGQQVCDADLIVFGLVTEAVKVSMPEGFFRLSSISPEYVLKGKLRPDQEQIIERSHAKLYSDPPWYRAGLEVVAFLRPIPLTPFYETVGRSQGRFVVVDGHLPGAKNLVAEDFLDEIRELLASEDTCVTGVPPVPY